VNMLARYLANRPEAENGRFFVGTNGDNLDRRYIYGIVRKYLKLADISKSKHGPHLFRHTFCTRLHQKGVGPFTIKDLAGHKSLNTTMRYIKIENKEQAEAIDRLEFGISFQREGAKPILNTGVIPFKSHEKGARNLEKYLGQSATMPRF